MRISVVTPNRNGAEWLRDCMESVLAAGQRVDLEYIVMDGASTDGSVEILRGYGQRLAFWASEPDAGQYDAVNRGLARATGEVLGFLNSDDVYVPDALETVVSVFEALPEVEWLTTLRPGWIGRDTAEPRFRCVPGYSAKAFEEGRYVPVNDGWSYGAIQQESTFWRRSLWERAGGALDISYPLAGDFELWSRFFRLAPLYAVDLPLAVFRYREGQRGAAVEAYMSEVRRLGSFRRPWWRRFVPYKGLRLRRRGREWTPESHHFLR